MRHLTIVPPTELPSSLIRNAMTVLRGVDPFTQSPSDWNANLTSAEALLFKALNQLEAPPVRGFLDSVPQAEPQADGDGRPA